MKIDRSFKLTHVFLVEPGLHCSAGHMRGEVEAFASGLLNLGLKCTVVGWKPPSRAFDKSINSQFVNSRYERLIESLPPKVGVRLLEFLTYRKAFSLGYNIKKCAILGLTASGPFGPALAVCISGKLPVTLLINRHLGNAAQRTTSSWRLAFEILARRGVALGAYSESVASSLRSILPYHARMIRHLPEVIADIPADDHSHSKKLHGVLLVSGTDSVGRRAPIRHLTELATIPFRKVILHDPSGRFEECDQLQIKHKSSVEFERVSTYFTSDFTAFLKTSSAVLVAYSPSFMNPSSILRHALSANVPAISSRFPDADFLHAQFGCIGETWTFDDTKSLSFAMDRFLCWNESNFVKLEQASVGLKQWANPLASARAHIQFMLDSRRPADA